MGSDDINMADDEVGWKDGGKTSMMPTASDCLERTWKEGLPYDAPQTHTVISS